MVNCLQNWPEPIVRVQSLSESGIRAIPERYIKRPSERPMVLNSQIIHTIKNNIGSDSINIPVIDLSHVFSDDMIVREMTLREISESCREWGFFQVVNHGVSLELMKDMLEMWREFFYLPIEEKQKFANSPTTYEGYGSRLGVEKGAVLDWSDYFFLHYFPSSLRDVNKWPSLPASCREVIAEYSDKVVKLCEILMKVLSTNLGLKDDHLQNSFGGSGGENNHNNPCDGAGACLRVNFYPKCPQPDLTLGLSSHSDPGGLTLLLPDASVPGLQVRQGDCWVTVKPIPNAFIVNIGDQIQVLSNAIYKSVEHRVMVNSAKERVSLALFYNPKSDIPIEPMKELVTEDRPSLYPTMTYNEYRRFIRTKGPCGKSQVESLISP